MAPQTLLNIPLVQEILLPFLFLFVVFFAILEKTKILGDDKKQIDALVSLALALIVVAFAYPVGVITKLILYFSVTVVVILVFMLLYGFVSSGKEGFTSPTWMKWVFGILIGISIVAALLWATGIWSDVLFFLEADPRASGIVSNAIFIIAIVVAMVLLLKEWKK
jgi:hypothetical protein